MNQPNTLRLPRSGVLKLAPTRTIETLEKLATPITVKDGEMLFQQGEEGNAMYAIEQGCLEISVTSPEGRKLSLDIVLPGDVIGEIALFDPGPRTATATAQGDTKLLSIKRPPLIDAILADPHLGLDITQMAARRMRLLTDQLHQQAFLRLPERLARKILHLTSKQPDNPNLLEVSHEELADYSGASREAVSKILAQWRQASIVELKRQKIEIMDRDELRMMGGIDIV